MRTILLFIFLNLLLSGALMATTPSTFDQLIVHIEQQLQHKEPIVVAISGFGGSGKSTLAEKLRLHFGLAEDELIQIDELNGPNRHGPDIFDQTDWPLLMRILEDVRAGKKLQYTGKDDKDRPVHRDLPLPRVVIVEGIRLLQPKLMPYFDVSVWIDCPQEIALGRAKARDRLQGENEETVSLWDTDWGPKDKIYFETYRPNQLAMFFISRT